MDRLILHEKEDGETLVSLLRSGVRVPLLVTGSSMMPLLRSGQDTVWLTAASPDHLRRGRILFFRRDSGAFILHRIRRRLPDGRLLLNGDAQSWCEITDAAHAVAVVDTLEIRGRQLRWNALRLRIWDLLWYPTRPLRPFLFRTYTALRLLWRRAGFHKG